jgi:hypothetical protein
LLLRPNSGSATIPQPGTTSAFAELVADMNRRERRRSPRRPYRSSRRRFEGRVCRAARRALAAAGAYLDAKGGLTLHMAAELFGSSVAYVTAAVIVMRSEDVALRDAVLVGRVPLLTAAKEVKRRADLVAAFRAADATDKLGFAHAVSPETVWNEVVEPACRTKAHEPAPTMADDTSCTVGDMIDAFHAAQ